MITKLTTVISSNHNPYENIALEEYLLNNVEDGECILYLWQNHKTVVIGRNQNPWKECDFQRLSAAGGLLARRLSGGGAVFHDMGNMNFTFLVKEEDYNVEKQTEVILKAVRSLGIDAVRTGRNDLEVDGRKFSGHAFYKTDGRCYHHGTILLNANMEEMKEYLNVSSLKLKSKGVDSVKSRVINLQDLRDGLDVEAMKLSLVEAFEEVYGLDAKPTSPRANLREIGREAKAIIREREKFFASWEWIFGRKIPFNYAVEKNFPWGNAEILLQVEGGIIRDAKIYSDDLSTANFDAICHKLIGKRHDVELIDSVWEEMSWKNTI